MADPGYVLRSPATPPFWAASGPLPVLGGVRSGFPAFGRPDQAMAGHRPRRPLAYGLGDDRRHPLWLPGQHRPREVDDDPTGSGQLIATPSIGLEAMPMLVVELPTVTLEQDRRPDETEVDLGATDHRMELDRWKLVVLDEPLHAPFQIAVEELAVDHPVGEGVAQRRHTRTATTSMHANGGEDRIGRRRSIGDE